MLVFFLLSIPAVALGLLAGYIDFYQSEVQLGALLVFIFAIIFGFVRSNVKNAWRWGILVGIGVPIAHIVLERLGYKESFPPQPNVYATFIALIPGICGSYLGMYIRKFLGEK